MFSELFYPRQAVLVSASSSEKTNLTAVEYFMPVSEKPPVVALSLHNTSLTLDLICTSMEFVVAIPSEGLNEAVLLCGTTSGKYIDKFAEARLTPMRAKRVSAPLVLEAYANLECKVLSYNSSGDHTVVVGEVLEIHPPKEEREGEPLLFNLGGKRLFGFKQH
ncbi:TPA: flavin reductase family protein [Candidatus Micrarchaeota archaeon]|nr:flavin reductase family protein [Candidatus Micrarchaeota archaeon]HIH31009.1 flavin reductase family protein [Candidatus Micrarchaeota archaeon]